MSNSQEKYIYESPDGGHTIYRRQIGNYDHRELVSIDQEIQDKWSEFEENKLWGAIRRKSQKDSTLKEMLDKIKVYYKLKYD